MKKDVDKKFTLYKKSKKDNVSVDLDLKKMKEFPPKVNKYERPRYAETAPNKTHQADVMFIPEDRQLPGQPTAALIVSDVASKRLDVRFLKEKTANETKKRSSKFIIQIILTSLNIVLSQMLELNLRDHSRLMWKMNSTRE